MQILIFVDSECNIFSIISSSVKGRTLHENIAKIK